MNNYTNGNNTVAPCKTSAGYTLNNETFDYLKNWIIHSGNNALAFSSSALRMFFLLNGMACVAILAFLGSVIEHDIRIGCSQIIALMCFVIGCVFSAMSAFCSYRAYVTHTNILARIISQKGKVPQDADTKKDMKNRECFKRFAVWFEAVSLVCFISGSAVFALSLQTINSAPSSTTSITVSADPTDKILDSDDLTAEEKIKMIKVLKK